MDINKSSSSAERHPLLLDDLSNEILLLILQEVRGLDLSIQEYSHHTALRD